MFMNWTFSACKASYHFAKERQGKEKRNQTPSLSLSLLGTPQMAAKAERLNLPITFIILN
jgi:hypothetical protein